MPVSPSGPARGWARTTQTTGITVLVMHGRAQALRLTGRLSLAVPLHREPECLTRMPCDSESVTDGAMAPRLPLRVRLTGTGKLAVPLALVLAVAQPETAGASDSGCQYHALAVSRAQLILLSHWHWHWQRLGVRCIIHGPYGTTTGGF